MSWIFLFFAGLFEIGWAIGLKYTDGFSKPLPTLLTVASMVVSLGLLGLALNVDAVDQPAIELIDRFDPDLFTEVVTRMIQSHLTLLTSGSPLAARGKPSATGNCSPCGRKKKNASRHFRSGHG